MFFIGTGIMFLATYNRYRNIFPVRLVFILVQTLFSVFAFCKTIKNDTSKSKKMKIIIKKKKLSINCSCYSIRLCGDQKSTWKYFVHISPSCSLIFAPFHSLLFQAWKVKPLAHKRNTHSNFKMFTTEMTFMAPVQSQFFHFEIISHSLPDRKYH